MIGGGFDYVRVRGQRALPDDELNHERATFLLQVAVVRHGDYHLRQHLLHLSAATEYDTSCWQVPPR